MYSRQHELPRLPLPRLPDTLARYLLAIEPLVPRSAFEKTSALVKEALADGSDLRALQCKLEARAATVDNYVADDWNAMYMEGRWPLLINSNPGVTHDVPFVWDAVPTTDHVVERGAWMVAGSLGFAEKVEGGTLEPNVFKGMPLDMAPYRRMFRSTRIPHPACDDFLKGGPEVEHVVVLRGAGFWRVPVYEPQTRRPLSVAQLAAALRHICAQPVAAAGPSLALLTWGERDGWAAARAELEAHSARNRASLRCIDEAIFHLCLDLAPVGSTVEERARSSLMGDATRAPRWADKSVSLFVGADGHTGCNFEHAWGDGLVLQRWTHEMVGYVHAHVRAAGGVSATDSAEARAPPRVAPERLVWELPPTLQATLGTALASHEAVAGALRISSCAHTRWSPAAIKACGLPPDGVVQQSLQLAYHKLEGRTPSTYQSCAMAHFAEGRTETIRSATLASRAFVLAAAPGSGVSAQEQAAALRAACRTHAALSNAAARGQGVDRHLFALRCLASRQGASMPALFTDATFASFSTIDLSTSTLPSYGCEQAIFGPVSAEGYGLLYCYPAPGDFIRLVATTYAPRDAAQFTRAIGEALALCERLAKLEPVEAKL